MALILRVEVQGTTPAELAAQEMCALAVASECIVKGIIDGIEMSARPADHPEEVLDDYRRDVRLSQYPTPN